MPMGTSWQAPWKALSEQAARRLPSPPASSVQSRPVVAVVAAASCMKTAAKMPRNDRKCMTMLRWANWHRTTNVGPSIGLGAVSTLAGAGAAGETGSGSEM